MGNITLCSWAAGILLFGSKRVSIVALNCYLLCFVYNSQRIPKLV